MSNSLEKVTIHSAIATQKFHLPQSISLLPLFFKCGGFGFFCVFLFVFAFNCGKTGLVSVEALSLTIIIICIMQSPMNSQTPKSSSLAAVDRAI